MIMKVRKFIAVLSILALFIPFLLAILETMSGQWGFDKWLFEDVLFPICEFNERGMLHSLFTLVVSVSLFVGCVFNLATVAVDMTEPDSDKD